MKTTNEDVRPGPEPTVEIHNAVDHSRAAPMVGLVLISLLVVAWGINWPAAKIVLTQISPLVHRALILSLGGLGLLAIARGTGFAVGIKRADALPFLLVTVFNVTGYQVFVTYGLFHMPAGRAAIVGNSTPLWVAFLSPWLLSLTLGTSELVGLLLGFGGLAVLIAPEFSTLGGSLLGDFLMVAAAISSAFGAIFMKFHKWQTQLSVLTGWSLIIGGIPIYVAVFILGDHANFAELTTSVWIAFLYTIAISTIFGNWCWFRIMTLLPAHKGASAIFGIPPVGLLASALLLCEPIRLTDLIGMSFVLAGISCTLFGRQSEAGD
jgi:drug/metabolite transporter (DMT)-like permease